MKQINFQDLHTYTGLPVFQSNDYKQCRLLAGYTVKGNKIYLLLSGSDHYTRSYDMDNIDLYASEETESIKAKCQSANENKQ